MSPFSRFDSVVSSREQLKRDARQAALLRDAYPQLAELRVEFDFDDGTARPPSLQSHLHFPPARGFFRYPCPCHSCNGEFDLSAHVAELAGAPDRARLVRRVEAACSGQRPDEGRSRVDCPVRANIRISATLRTPEQTS